jgi:isopentenyl-diphosphate delta-isomerase type 1
MDDWFEVVDEHDRVIGRARRSECHGNPALVHRVAHVLVFNSNGQLLLQKRSMNKDIQPGKWDTSVGGHLDPGEDYLTAARREMQEELGIKNCPLTFMYHSRIRNEIESENVGTFLAVYDGEIHFPQDEIDAVRFWRPEEIDSSLGHDIFTPNFEEEWQMLQQWNSRYGQGAEQAVRFCRGDSFPDLFSQLQKESEDWCSEKKDSGG